MPPFAPRRTAITLAAAVAGVAPVGAQELIGARELAGFPNPPADYVIPYGEDPLQFGKLRLPEGAGPHPVVVFVHGGCWLSQFDIAHAAAAEEALADAGYAVWSLEYRRVGDEGGGWPSTYQDVGRGADHLRKLAGAHALDTTRVVASGHSAGGTFALWLAGRGAIPPASPLHAADPLPVHAVVALAPAGDLEGLHARGVCGRVVDRLMGGSPAEHPDRYAAASPMRLAPVGVPQTLLIGGLDAMWAPPGRAYYHHAVTVGDSQVRSVNLPESGHFEMILPTTSSWPAVLGAFREAFARVEAGR